MIAVQHLAQAALSKVFSTGKTLLPKTNTTIHSIVRQDELYPAQNSWEIASLERLIEGGEGQSPRAAGIEGAVCKTEGNSSSKEHDGQHHMLKAGGMQ